MKMIIVGRGWCLIALLVSFLNPRGEGWAADKLIGFHSARTMSQSMP